MSNNDFREGSNRGNKVEECLKRVALEPSNSTSFVVRAEIKFKAVCVNGRFAEDSYGYPVPLLNNLDIAEGAHGRARQRGRYTNA